MAWCEELIPFWLRRTAHEEARCQLGRTVDEYRRMRRWLEGATDLCAAHKAVGEHLTVEEALRQVADQHVRFVMQFGQMRASGRTFEQIRGDLGLSERDLDLVAEWWRDGVAAVSERRSVERS